MIISINALEVVWQYSCHTVKKCRNKNQKNVDKTNFV